MDLKVDKDREKKRPFEVDSRITMHIHPELASQLSALILSTDTKNPALLAIAHQLSKQHLSFDNK